jgi:hypothetical protein
MTRLNMQDDALGFGRALVEPRYVQLLVSRLANDGLDID